METESNACANAHPPLNLPHSRKSWIDSAYTSETTLPKVRNGVKMGEGDGTVSLLSLGAMCVEGWKRERWNPAGIKIKTIEVRVSLFWSAFAFLAIPTDDLGNDLVTS